MADPHTDPPSLPYPSALASESHATLALLAACPPAREFYLAGSAALALHLGHRPVRDLDLMGTAARLRPADRRDLLAALRGADSSVAVETARDGYLFVRVGGDGAGVGVRFHYYPYPLVDSEHEQVGVAVAGRRDLGAMKLGAVISRGTRRDFLDLYLLCQAVPLATLLAAAEEKFGHVRDFTLQAMKALADVDAATEDPLPALVRPVSWASVRAWALDAALAATAAHLAGEEVR
jgi:hypothetical protein